MPDPASHRVRWLDVVLRPVRKTLEWIGRHETGVLVALLLICLAVSGFVALADQVVEGDTQRFDDWAVRVLRQPDHPELPIGPGWFTEVARDITALGGVTFVVLLTATVAGFLFLRRMYGAALLVTASTVGGSIVNMLLKHAFSRPRPELVPHLSHVMTSSFPSGHSMLSATVFLTLGTLLGRFVPELRLKAYFLLVAIGLTLMVGLSRVYMGVHYPTDVLAGWTAGLAWALACWLIARFLQGQGKVLPTLQGELR
jgi:undecaprenyl-diphosphatase